MRIRITAPGWAYGTGYHVRLDDDHSRTDYAFNRDEFGVCS